MASITKLPDRKGKPWQVRIRRKGQTIVEYFRLKKDADAFAAKVEADFDRWARVFGGELRRHTLAELIDRYITIWTGKDTNGLGHLEWWRRRFGERLLSEFTSATAREALAALEVEPLPSSGRRGQRAPGTCRTPATLNRYKSALSACYKAGIDRGWFGLQDNPLSGIRARRENNARFGRCLEDDERARLLAACDESPIWADLGLFVRLALATGARRGELLKLNWRDVDLKAGAVRFRETKNGDDRAVPLLGEARELLIDHAKVRRLGDPRVFPGPTPDRPAWAIDKAWRAAKAAAEVENLRIHDLRHSCGSYLARAGASAFQIAAILGHRSGPGLTARYVHLVAEDSRALLETALSGVIGEGKP